MSWRISSLAFLASAAVLGSSETNAAYTFTFDNSSQYTATESGFGYNPTVPNFRFDNGTASPTATHSATYSTNNKVSPSPAGSGSVKVSMALNYAADGQGGAAYTVDLFGSPSPTNVTNISFDIMQETGSAKDAFGGGGYFQVAVRSDSYAYTNTSFAEEFGNPSYSAPTAGTFEHISIPVTGALQNVRALTFAFYNSSDRQINGNLIFDLDNIVLTQSTDATPEPASLGLLALAAPALIRRRRA